MKNCFFLAILLGLYMAGGPLAAQETTTDNGFSDRRLRDKSAYRQKTMLGVFSIGTQGLVKDERQQAKTGELEVGSVFEFKNDQFIPDVLELETFFVNRIGTYEDSLYESLGLGAGAQLNYRKAGQPDKWFLRFSGIQPTEYYMEQQGVGSERTVFELILGRSYALAPATSVRATTLTRRLAAYTLAVSIPAEAVENTTWRDANAAVLLNQYLTAHYMQMKQADIFTYDDMNIFDFVIHRSGVSLLEREARLLELHDYELVIKDTWEPTFRSLFRRAITLMLRDKCVLVLKVSDAQAMQSFTAIPDGEIQQDNAMDMDHMIETYLDSLWKRFKSPVN